MAFLSLLPPPERREGKIPAHGDGGGGGGGTVLDHPLLPRAVSSTVGSSPRKHVRTYVCSLRTQLARGIVCRPHSAVLERSGVAGRGHLSICILGAYLHTHMYTYCRYSYSPCAEILSPPSGNPSRFSHMVRTSQHCPSDARLGRSEGGALPPPPSSGKSALAASRYGRRLPGRECTPRARLPPSTASSRTQPRVGRVCTLYLPGSMHAGNRATPPAAAAVRRCGARRKRGREGNPPPPQVPAARGAEGTCRGRDGGRGGGSCSATADLAERALASSARIAVGGGGFVRGANGLTGSRERDISIRLRADRYVCICASYLYLCICKLAWDPVQNRCDCGLRTGHAQPHSVEQNHIL